MGIIAFVAGQRTFETSHNGNDAVGWLDNHDYYTLIWNNGEYVIEINSNLDKTQLIEIARSVQKAQ